MYPYSTFSQEGYFRVGGGYALATAKASLNSYLHNDNLNGIGIFYVFDNPMLNISVKEGSPVTEVVHDSYGKGIITEISGGYMLHPHMGLELGISYLFGRDVKSSWNLTPLSNVITNGNSRFTSLFLTSSLVISAGNKRLNPYARLGMVFGLTPKIESELYGSSMLLPFYLKDQLTGGIAVGFSVALGFSYPINERMNLFGELVYNAVRYKPRSRQVMEVSLFGQQLDVSSIYTFPKQKLEDNTPLIVNAYTQETLRAYSSPVNYIALNIGLEFRFLSSK